MNNPLVQPDPGLAIWTILTFLVLLWFLKKIAWKPLLRALESRKETIQKSMDAAQQAKQELERLNRESAQILRNAHAEAELIISKSRSEAEKLREELKQKARMDSEAILREAQGRIEMETGRAIRQIRSEIVDMSIEIASRLLRRNVSKEDNRELIEETLRQMESGPRPS